MPRQFNVGGVNNPRIHYTLPALRQLPGVRGLVDGQQYFVVDATLRAGKTTALWTLAQELTAEGTYAAVLVSVVTGASFRDRIGTAENAILASWEDSARARMPKEFRPPPWPDVPPGSRIRIGLQTWAEACPRPLVVFIDEIDALEGETLISILRQLRDGHADRPEHFPWSLAVIGMRNVRDYKIASGGADRTHSASPFNVVAKALTLRNFTRDEIAELYAQHTEETGQVFLPETVDRAFEMSGGQPWLVNAIAREMVGEIATDPQTTLTPAHVDQAKDILVERQDTHLDSLAERLREPRVRSVIEPILLSTHLSEVPPDDRRFVADLGLVRMKPDGAVEIANPIYEEIIVRMLSGSIRASIPTLRPTWLKQDGRIDFNALLDAFLLFWRQHGAPLLGSTPYHEFAPHLVLMSFLHRVVNGGGTIEREYAIGRGRMDLHVRKGADQFAVEIKVWRNDGDADPLREGLEQIDEYLSGLNLDLGWLAIFDRRPSAVPVAQRLGTSTATTPQGKTITVIRG